MIGSFVVNYQKRAATSTVQCSIDDRLFYVLDLVSNEK